MAVDRRRFLQTAAVIPGAVLAGRLSPAPARGQATDLDPAQLRALGEAVLPSELGPAGITRVVTDFRTWLAEYRPVAEADHGYGTGELEYTPAHPGPGWASQLAALDLEARERHQQSFASLDLAGRRELVRTHIARERIERFPNPIEAHHVAVALSAYFFESSEASDLCHQATIGAFGCRPLSQVTQKPTTKT